MGPRRDAALGFTLIELMVSLSILAILVTLASPTLAEWIRNARLRSTAEALRSGLQQARAEAIRLNTGTRLQFVTTLASDCALSATGTYWVINAGLAQTPAGACGSAPSATAAPFVIGSSTTTGRTGVTITSTRSTIGFDSLGRQSATTNPTTAIAKVTVQVTSTSGSCVAAGGDVRCLNVLVFSSGETRICDPTRTGTTDPMVC
jgi:type IV fimbrial biogenesis protein FimT